jgi:hypothetical protein
MASGSAAGNGSVGAAGAGGSSSPAKEAANEHLGERAASAAFTQWYKRPKPAGMRI